MKSKLIIGIILLCLISTAQGKVTFGTGATVTIDDSESVGLLTGILQGIEDLFTADTRDDDGYCQILIDNNETFESPEINHRVWTTDYTHDEFLNPGNYFIKVRCRENDRWGFWTDTEVHTHNNQQNTIYVDWTF